MRRAEGELSHAISGCLTGNRRNRWKNDTGRHPDGSCASLFAPVYHHALESQKQHILEECVTATGYARTYAQWLLNQTEEIFTTPVVLRRRYGPEVFAAVLVAWILVCSYYLL